MDDMEMQAALKGAAVLAPPSSRQLKREPFTVTLMEDLLQFLDLTDPFDAAVAACLTTVFWSVAL